MDQRLGPIPLPAAYTVPSPFGRLSTLIPELWSILWLGWWTVSLLGGPTLFHGHAWTLMAHLPQAVWAFVCALIASTQVVGLYLPRLHRPATIAAGLFWLTVVASFLMGSPLTTGVMPYLSIGVTLVFVAVEAQPE